MGAGVPARRGRTLAGTWVVAMLALLVFAPSALAQEARICTKWDDHLKPQSGPYNLGNDRDSVIGTDKKDRILAEGGDDLINGGRGSDHVDGGEGDDVLCGGRGNDTLEGGPGNDVIFGEEENDTIVPGPDDDRVLGSEGDDKLIGYGGQPGSIIDNGIDILDGGFNNDVIIAGGADSLYGFTHNDKLSTKTPDIAPKVMDGGGNDDKLKGSNANDKMKGGENGKDVLKGLGGNDEWTAGATTTTSSEATATTASMAATARTASTEGRATTSATAARSTTRASAADRAQHPAGGPAVPLLAAARLTDAQEHAEPRDVGAALGHRPAPEQAGREPEAPHLRLELPAAVAARRRQEVPGDPEGEHGRRPEVVDPEVPKGLASPPGTHSEPGGSSVDIIVR